MDAGGGHKVFVPLSRAVVIVWLATEHMVAGHLDQAEAAAAELEDAPVAQELRRKIAARRDGGAQPERKQAMTPERWKQIELLDRVYFGITDLTQSRERVQAQITALKEQLAKLEQQIGKARQFGREDLAQEALTRLNSGQSQIATLKSQLDQLLAQRVKLTAAAQTLQAKIDGAGGTTAL
jgi:chromosome segregation ATPase